jgi:UDP-GlcNAc3NAcA epimerase
MKVVTVVGARPQFIKATSVSRELRRSATEILVHTGQHYDDNMSGVFFRELQIPKPNYHLGIGSASHGRQTGEMLAAIEEVLLTEGPDVVLVYGDTNTTLAGALAAAKLHIRIAHVESGLRSFNKRMPEEVNRLLTDHLADLLFCPTETAVHNLALEGISKGVHLVGDVMLGSLRECLPVAERTSTILSSLGLQSKTYILATVHRAENTDRKETLVQIIGALRDLVGGGQQVVLPIHPRTRDRLLMYAEIDADGITLINPVSYVVMIALEKNARVILTDSGGVQKEAYWFGIPCVTLREETEWVETLHGGWNVLVGTDPKEIVRATMAALVPPARLDLTAFGDENAAARLVKILLGDTL